MLKEGFLAGSQISTSYAYNDKIIKKYFTAVNKVFRKISKAIMNNNLKIKGEIKHSTFKRLTG